MMKGPAFAIYRLSQSESRVKLWDFPAGKFQRNGSKLRNPSWQRRRISYLWPKHPPIVATPALTTFFSPQLPNFCAQHRDSLANQRMLFFKQISFHAKFTFQRLTKLQEPVFDQIRKRRQKCLCNLTTVKEKAYKPSPAL